MAQSNENADLLKGNNSGGGAGNGSGSGDAKKGPVIDIKKFLQKSGRKYGKSISGLLETLFRDQLFKESDWPQKVKDAVERQVK